MSAGVTGRFASATFQYFLDLFTVEDGHRQGYLSLMAETAIVVGDRKELTYLLSQAAELEHGLLCEYLYAAFSLKSTAGPDCGPISLSPSGGGARSSCASPLRR